MDAFTLMLTMATFLNPAPALFDPPPLQVAPSREHRRALAVKADARRRADAELREWRAERRRVARERREAERRARQVEAAAARAAAAPARTYSSGVEQWRGLFERYFPGHVEEALYVIRGESGGNPRASNGICRGLFQIHECHASAFRRVTGLPYFDGVYDPEANVRFAAYMSRGGADWSAWSVRP
ncbi:MAG TPA: transglycosylase SLT domain-containing protein [Gemmatimonadales bacterium]|nr:transglycosylase SLT domain-containing protein [Gemmatimonadales bacterium]